LGVIILDLKFFSSELIKKAIKNKNSDKSYEIYEKLGNLDMIHDDQIKDFIDALREE